ncbi:preprotein translocase subunit SecE [bacterium]|nr:preprotein translocase subunit SecE [bacterium]
MPKFITSILNELKKTKWPSKADALKLTAYTIVFCVVLSLAMIGLDLLFIQLREWFLNI